MQSSLIPACILFFSLPSLIGYHFAFKKFQGKGHSQKQAVLQATFASAALGALLGLIYGVILVAPEYAGHAPAGYGKLPFIAFSLFTFVVFPSTGAFWGFVAGAVGSLYHLRDRHKSLLTRNKG